MSGEKMSGEKMSRVQMSRQTGTAAGGAWSPADPGWRFLETSITPRKAWITRNGGLPTGSGAATLGRCSGTGAKSTLMNESVAICSGGCQHVWVTKLACCNSPQGYQCWPLRRVLVLTFQEDS